MRKKLFLPMAALLLMTTACSIDRTEESELSELDKAERNSGQIVFSSTTIGSQVTRGTQTTTATLTKYGVSSEVEYHSETYYKGKMVPVIGFKPYFLNEEIIAATGRSKYYWPGSSYESIFFYAYAPYGEAALTVDTSSMGSHTGPQYTYTVPENVADHLDFMTAHQYSSATPKTTPVVLEFRHRCSDIRFTCENIGAEAVILKSIAINGVKYSGTVTTMGMWMLDNTLNSPTSHPFSLSVEKTIAPNETLDATGETGHFIMLPQSVAAGTQIFDIYATITATGETGHFYYTLTEPLELEEGKVYNFNIKLSDVIEVAAAVAEWTEETDRTGIPTYDYNINTSFGVGSWEKEQ